MRIAVTAWILVALVAAHPQSGPSGSLARTIPYHFDEPETRYFTDSHRNWPEVRDYLRDPSSTPWGIVVEDYGRDFLLFRDARSALHVVEVTGLPIVEAVRKSPYRSPRFEVIDLK